MKDIYTLLQMLVGLAGTALVLEFLRYNKAAVAAWWTQRVNQELRDCRTWADPKKACAAYKSEVKG